MNNLTYETRNVIKRECRKGWVHLVASDKTWFSVKEGWIDIANCNEANGLALTSEGIAAYEKAIGSRTR